MISIRNGRMITAGTMLSAALALTACNPSTSDGRGVTAGASGDSATAGATGATPDATTGPVPEGLYMVPPVDGAELVADMGDGYEHRITVTSVESQAGGQAVETTEKVAGHGNELEFEVTYLTRSDGSLQLPFHTLLSLTVTFDLPDTDVEATGDDAVIPPVAELADGATSGGDGRVDLTRDGQNSYIEASYEVSGRGYESVTVPAGTFDAYVVEVAVDAVASTGDAQQGTFVYWLVPGFANVKQEGDFAGSRTGEELIESTVSP